jgi:RbsD/FucU transport protein family protein
MKLMWGSILLASTLFAQQKPWRDVLNERLPYYGHRNWIVIADSAYPLQSAPGIETIVSNESQTETVRHVLDVLSRAKHVRPVAYTDLELNHVPEPEAAGIDAYRQLLQGLFDKFLPDQKIVSIRHEDIINKLDAASKTFNVLIIKTNMALPYTSVFLELRAAYWSDEAEQRLRQSIR